MDITTFGIRVDYIPFLSHLQAPIDLFHIFTRSHHHCHEGSSEKKWRFSLEKGTFLRVVFLFIPVFGNIALYLADRDQNAIESGLSAWVESVPPAKRYFYEQAQKKILKCFDARESNLDLSRLRLETLPKEIGRLTWLKTLDCCGNILQELPSTIANLKQLSKLLLNQNQLSGALPECITELTELTELDLNLNNITELHQSISKLSKLSRLSLASNSLAELPPSIGSLSKLSFLSLYNNRLSGALPECITELTELTELNLSGNELTELPQSISKLSKLSRLDLGTNALTEIHPSIGRLSELSFLNLYDNRLSGTLPECITELTELTTLDLSENELTGLPQSIDKLSKLNYLWLKCNRLTELPASISRITTLQSIDVSYNPQIASIPIEGESRLAEENFSFIRNNITIYFRGTSIRLEPLETSFAEFDINYLRFLNDWTRDERNTLALWLQRLKLTQDYLLASQGGKLRRFKAIIGSNLELLENEALKDRFLSTIGDNNIHCGDRASMGFSSIYVELQLHKILISTEATLKDKIKMLLRGALTFAVHNAMNAKIKSEAEVVEHFLFCELEINKRANFPLITFNTQMLYRDIGSKIDKAKIKAIRKRAKRSFVEIFYNMDAFERLVPESVTSTLLEAAQAALEELQLRDLSSEVYNKEVERVAQQLKADTFAARQAWLREQLGEGVLEHLITHPKSWGRS